VFIASLTHLLFTHSGMKATTEDSLLNLYVFSQICLYQINGVKITVICPAYTQSEIVSDDQKPDIVTYHDEWIDEFFLKSCNIIKHNICKYTLYGSYNVQMSVYRKSE